MTFFFLFPCTTQVLTLLSLRRTERCGRYWAIFLRNYSKRKKIMTEFVSHDSFLVLLNKGSIHTDAFSFEKTNFGFHFRVLFTQIFIKNAKCSLTFENVFQREIVWKSVKLRPCVICVIFVLFPRVLTCKKIWKWLCILFSNFWKNKNASLLMGPNSYWRSRYKDHYTRCLECLTSV